MKAKTITSDHKMTIIEIGAKMHSEHLPSEFIASAVEIAFEFEGVLDLMMMWSTEKEEKERQEIIADIQELIEDCAQNDVVEGVYVRFDDLEGIAKNIRAFKDQLRILVDSKGGLTNLSKEIGIPQPSLSRFFNSASMPRRMTLNKIARALGLNQVQIATEWAK